MIIICRNKTAIAIPELNLVADELKFVFYRKSFFTKDPLVIRNHIYDNKIDFLDEHGLPLLKKIPGSVRSDGILNEGALAEMFMLFTTDYKSNNDEYRANIESKIADSIKRILRLMFRKAKVNNEIPDYTFTTLITILASTKISDLLDWGAFVDVGNAINGITTDDFFTVPRKLKLKSLCDCIEL